MNSDFITKIKILLKDAITKWIMKILMMIELSGNFEIRNQNMKSETFQCNILKN